MYDLEITSILPVIRINSDTGLEESGLDLGVWDYTGKSHKNGIFKNVYIVLGTEGTKIDTVSMGKDFFLAVMSKLYDMAEVK